MQSRAVGVTARLLVIVRNIRMRFGFQFVIIDKNAAFGYLLLTESEFYAIMIWS